MSGMVKRMLHADTRGAWARRLFASACASFVVAGALVFPGRSNAAQPVETISREPMKYFVKQGPAQCGPASFSMVFKYYGDAGKKYPYFYDREGSPVDLGPGTGRTGSGMEIVNEGDPVSLWIKGKDNSTDWKKLVEAVQGLCCKNEKGLRVRYYEVVDSYDEVTGTDDKGREVRKINFTERMVPEFLDNDRPVIIHLKRKWPFSGHYIVVVGFDSVAGKVFYMDPNGDGSGALGSVSLDDFMNEYWYKGNAPSWWGRARWSGKWLGFYRLGAEQTRRRSSDN